MKNRSALNLVVLGSFIIIPVAKISLLQWNLDLTKPLGTGEICSLYRGFVISGYTVYRGFVISGYTVYRGFVISGYTVYRGFVISGYTVYRGFVISGYTVYRGFVISGYTVYRGFVISGYTVYRRPRYNEFAEKQPKCSVYRGIVIVYNCF